MGVFHDDLRRFSDATPPTQARSAVLRPLREGDAVDVCACQFDDGGVGMCGRDDKWLGFTADGVSQVAMLKERLPADHPTLVELLQSAKRASSYIDNQISTAKLRTTACSG